MKVIRRGAALVLLLALTLPLGRPTERADAHEAGGFRLFSMGYKQLLSNAESYETWAQSIEERIAQIEPLLSEHKPNVVVFPESITLTAWLIGPRGVQARQEENNSLSAIASLAGPYAPQVSYYEAKCNVPPGRALVLALTDTVWRAFGETFARLAKEHEIHLVATADVAAEFKKVTDPAKAQLLGDPDLNSGYAYEAECDKAYNQAYFFAPMGEMFAADGSMPIGTSGAQIRGVVPKAYLVPIERDQTAGLALSSGSPADVRPVDLGFASFGVFTSKDAWMSDLPNRNDVDGADIFLQPEAGPWAAWDDTGVKNWKQDAMHRALWGFVQKLPSIRYGALSNLMGNFYDLPFDGTPTITSDAPDHRYSQKGLPNARHFLLGRRVTDGIVARSKWVAPDPPEGISFKEVTERRKALWSAGAKRGPDSGEPEENGYRDNAFVWTDIPTIDEPPSAPRLRRGPFGKSGVVAASQGAQWEPSLAVSRGGRVVLGWTDLTEGDEDAVVAALGKKGWTAPHLVSPEDSRPDDQQDNQYGVQLAVTKDRVHAVWVDFRNQSWEVRSSSAPVATLEFEDDVRVDHAKSSAEGYPNELLDNDPAIVARRNGTVVAAWSDLRGRRVDRDVRLARLRPGGWKGDEYAPQNHDRFEQFHPSLGLIGGRPEVAWQDHARGDANIYVSGRFSPCHDPPPDLECPAVVIPRARVDDGPLDSDAMMPALVGGPRGLPIVAWSDDRSGIFQIRAARVSRSGHRSKSVVVARGPGEQSYPSIVRVGRKRWVVTWTDERAGDTDITAATLRLAGGKLRPGRAWRVDDSAGASARLPSVTFDGERVVFAWEDLRSGHEQIRAASVRAEKLIP